MTATQADPATLARNAAGELAERTGVDRHDIAVVLGSGWIPAADALGAVAAELPTSEVAGFAAPSVPGHAGRVRSVNVSGRSVLVFLGRTHLYENRGVAAVVHGVRTAVAAGCRIVVLTNASGAVRPGLKVRDPVLIRDHLNLTWRSPLEGAQFLDLTNLWSPRLRRLVAELDPSIPEGVYAMFPGPHYETPAEVRMAAMLGADLVGMSTVLEAIAAYADGAEVLGISLVTNAAAGLGEPLDHAEVLAAGETSAGRVGELLRRLIARLEP